MAKIVTKPNVQGEARKLENTQLDLRTIAVSLIEKGLSQKAAAVIQLLTSLEWILSELK